MEHNDAGSRSLYKSVIAICRPFVHCPLLTEQVALEDGGNRERMNDFKKINFFFMLVIYFGSKEVTRWGGGVQKSEDGTR